MSTDVTIDRLTGALVGGPDTAATRAWLDTTLRDVAGTLPHELTRARLPDGLWFLPRLDLVLRIPTRNGLTAAWSRAIVDALTDALRHRAEWVHYANDVEMLTDVVVSAAQGSREREWVWRQAGLLPAAPATPVTQVVAALATRPHLAVPALAAAAGRVGVAALDRVLGVRGWLEVAQVAGVPLEAATDEAVAPASGPVAAPLLARSRLGRLLLDSRLRPAPQTLVVWAALVVADAEPALLGSPQGAPARRAVAATLRRALPGPGTTAPPAPVPDDPPAPPDRGPRGGTDEVTATMDDPTRGDPTRGDPALPPAPATTTEASVDALPDPVTQPPAPATR
ncbi:hypothetical protein PU560_10890, partial [Georgenia sp. 10Sc9-8]|nr:hypothetical protein [Georgenia halotolerans]